MRHVLSVLACLSLATIASAQSVGINQPAFGSTYTASTTRGFWFTCPVDSVLVDLQVPNEATQPNQVVEIIDYGLSPPPTWPATIVGTTLFYNNTTAAGAWIPANVNLLAGHNYGVLGACTASPTGGTSYNSYSSVSSYDTSVWGFPVTLRRLGTQFAIASTGPGQATWTENSTVSRVSIRITQEQAPMPAFESSYSSSTTRGFWFQAPVTCSIAGLQVPNEGAQAYQVVEVIDFGTSAPPAFPATATGTQLFYANTATAGTTIPCSVLLRTGRYYGILGACTPTPFATTGLRSSYAPIGPFTGHMMGLYSFTASRLLTQSAISSNGGNQPCSSEAAYNLGRVFVTFAGAGTINASNNDYYSPTTGWPAYGISAPGPVIGIRIGNPSFTVNGPSTAAGSVILGMLNFGALAQPGTTCLAPLGGTYAGQPTVAACNGLTNMSWDLPQMPFGSWVFFYGIPNTSGNYSTVINIPGFAGVYGATQAIVFDYTAGFAVTEAFNWQIVP